MATKSFSDLPDALAAGRITPECVAEQSLACANSNLNKNVYLSLDPERALAEARSVQAKFSGLPKPPLYGLPISLKDCFDLAGFPTTCGSRFYARNSSRSAHDSGVVLRLRAQGAVVIGKTHLNSLAYGITGENADYGDCLQPGSDTLLTGGSSSGAAASVLEGSAYAAVGTDTGGSLRVPAALCGLASYRVSLHFGRRLGFWQGCVPLSPSFDTFGWIFRDLRDAALFAEGFLGLSLPRKGDLRVRIACPNDDFVHDCDPVVRAAYAEWQRRLMHLGATMVSCDTSFWNEALSIFSPIQAQEAAAIHRGRTGGDYSCFEPAIAERLAWGASISAAELEGLRVQHGLFRERMDEILHETEFLMVPCSPLSRLEAGADHAQTRLRILRYTTPMSLAGVPVVTLPGKRGAGIQLVAARGGDLRLLSYAAEIGARIAEREEGN